MFLLCVALSQFIDFARDFCDKIVAQGYWADFIDPCSGLPMITSDCSKVCNMQLYAGMVLYWIRDTHSIISDKFNLVNLLLFLGI